MVEIANILQKIDNNASEISERFLLLFFENFKVFFKVKTSQIRLIKCRRFEKKNHKIIKVKTPLNRPI